MSRRRLTLQSQTLGTKPADFLSKPGCAPKDPNSRELSRFLWLISAALSRLSLEPRGAWSSAVCSCRLSESPDPPAPPPVTSRPAESRTLLERKTLANADSQSSLSGLTRVGPPCALGLKQEGLGAGRAVSRALSPGALGAEFGAWPQFDFGLKVSFTPN